METKIIATSNFNEMLSRDEMEKFSGLAAGVCYMPNDFETLFNEPKEKTDKRILQTKSSGHHSVFDHVKITLQLTNIPKLFAMLLNNEKDYTTSEKSARYTKMQPSKEEAELYEKWIPILENEIKTIPNLSNYFSPTRITKLAQENARYFISVLTPTSMLYTTSYRQLNYIYNWLKKMKDKPNEIYQLLVSYADEFCKELEETGLIDGMLKDDKNRFFSLVGERTRKEHFGETYSVNYKGSFASLAQAQRHRTLSYEINPQIKKEYYIPKIIEKNEDLKLQWQEDMEKIIDNHPQAQLLTINERGTVENLILKAKERLCTCAQLEISNQTKNTLTRYVNECDEPEIVDYLKPYTKGARCTFPDYKCPNSCNYKDGITLEREI